MNISDLELKTFRADMDRYARKMSMGVMLCILSPILLISMAGFDNGEGIGSISESAYVAVGLITLLIMVAIGVMYIITGSIEVKKYRYIREGEFQLEFNRVVSLNEDYYAFEENYGKRMAVGVALCIISPIPLITFAILAFSDTVILLMVSLLLILVAIAVNIFIKSSIKRNSYLQLLRIEDFDPANRKAAKLEESVGSIYWPVVVAIFLGWSFIKSAWMISWVVFPIAGLIYAGIVNLIKRY